MRNIASIAFCTLGAIIGFMNGTWWSIILAIFCVLGVAANIAQIIKGE